MDTSSKNRNPKSITNLIITQSTTITDGSLTAELYEGAMQIDKFLDSY